MLLGMGCASPDRPIRYARSYETTYYWLRVFSKNIEDNRFRQRDRKRVFCVVVVPKFGDRLLTPWVVQKRENQKDEVRISTFDNAEIRLLSESAVNDLCKQGTAYDLDAIPKRYGFLVIYCDNKARILGASYLGASHFSLIRDREKALDSNGQLLKDSRPKALDPFKGIAEQAE